MKRNILVDLIKAYLWLGVAVCLYCIIDGDGSYFWTFAKYAYLIAYIYKKVEGRLLALCLTAVSIIYVLTQPFNVYNLVDLLGMSGLFYYILNEKP